MRSAPKSVQFGGHFLSGNHPSIRNSSSKATKTGHQPTSGREPAVTNARFASFHGLPVGPFPLSTTLVPLSKSRARHKRHPLRPPHERPASVCGSNAGAVLQPHSAIRSIPSSASHSRLPTADRSHDSFIRRFEQELIIPNRGMLHSPSEYPPIEKPLGGRRDNAMKTGTIVWRCRTRQGYYGSIRFRRSRFRSSLTRPPPPSGLALRFSSRESVAF